MPGLSRSPLLFGFSRSACAGSRPARADLVRRDFTSPVPTYKPVGDITYLRTAAHGKGALGTALFLEYRLDGVCGSHSCNIPW
jgi:hypothetical protein